jgi:TetR/AcrR family transcriptional regulator
MATNDTDLPTRELPKPASTHGEPSRRDRILLAAAEEFAAKGFAAVRIDQIALKSGCNKQLIYYYFESKAGLRDAVLTLMVDRAAPMWRDVSGATLHEGLRLLFGRPGEGVSWARMIAWEGVEFGDPASPDDIVLEERRTRAYATQTELIRRAQHDGRLPVELDAEMMSVLISMLAMSRSFMPQVIRMITGLDANGEDYADRLQRFVGQLVDELAPGQQQPSADRRDQGGGVDE